MLEIHVRIGGGSRIRTGDILLAKQTLYQLSYIPTRDLVGVDGVEPSTSSLSGTRSNHLSYTPMCIFGRETEQKHLREGFILGTFQICDWMIG